MRREGEKCQGRSLRLFPRDLDERKSLMCRDSLKKPNPEWNIPSRDVQLRSFQEEWDITHAGLQDLQFRTIRDTQVIPRDTRIPR